MSELEAALLRAQRAVEALPLDGKTKGGGSYRYSGAETVITVCRRALHEHGLCVSGPTSQQTRVTPAAGEVTLKSGEVRPVGPIVEVVSTYLLTHPETGQSRPLGAASAQAASVQGDGAADLGTACAQARTYALRDMLRDLLLAPKGREQDLSSAPAALGPPPAGPEGPKKKTPKKSEPRPDPKQPPREQHGAKPYGAADAPGGEHEAPLDLVEAELRRVGWSDQDAAELCLAPGEETAMPEAALEVHRGLVEAGGRDLARKAWASVGMGPDEAKAACKGHETINWETLRQVALARGADA